MISWLKGTVQIKDDVSATIAIQGIGYRVFMLEQELAMMQSGAAVELFIHQYHRENSGSELYGFLQHETQLFFERLLSISGIGPKGGLGILEQASPRDLQQAIRKGDSTVLTKVSGIGKKTAERIIVELKGKIEKELGEEDTQSIADTAAAIDALTQLGYGTAEAREALQRVPSSATTVSAKVKAALQRLGGER